MGLAKRAPFRHTVSQDETIAMDLEALRIFVKVAERTIVVAVGCPFADLAARRLREARVGVKLAAAVGLITSVEPKCTSDQLFSKSVATGHLLKNRPSTL